MYYVNIKKLKDKIIFINPKKTKDKIKTKIHTLYKYLNFNYFLQFTNLNVKLNN